MSAGHPCQPESMTAALFLHRKMGQEWLPGVWVANGLKSVADGTASGWSHWRLVALVQRMDGYDLWRPIAVGRFAKLNDRCAAVAAPR